MSLAFEFHAEAWAVWPGWDREPVVRPKGVHSFSYRVGV